MPLAHKPVSGAATKPCYTKAAFTRFYFSFTNIYKLKLQGMCVWVSMCVILGVFYGVGV